MWLVLYMIGFFFLFLFPFTRLFWVTRDITIKVGILKVHSFYITRLIIWAVLSTHNLHWNALRFHGISKSTKHGITHEWRRYRMMTVSFLISDEIHIERVSYSVEHAIFIRPMLQTNSIAFYYCLFSNLLPRVQTCWFHILPRGCRIRHNYPCSAVVCIEQLLLAPRHARCDYKFDSCWL